MLLEKDFIYHIYNQGNNHRKIFFSQENYLFFLEKIKTYITPYADILAWCLMPNHLACPAGRFSFNGISEL